MSVRGESEDRLLTRAAPIGAKRLSHLTVQQCHQCTLSLEGNVETQGTNFSSRLAGESACPTLLTNTLFIFREM
jgi:hypothetical protein